MVQTDCLADAEIRDFVSERSAPKLIGRITRHLADCDCCRKRVLGEVQSTLDSIATHATTRAREVGRTDDSLSALKGVVRDPSRRYALLDVLSRGDDGIFYDAYDSALERKVVVKWVHRGADRDLRQLVAEGRALARISHPNVIGVYDVAMADDYAYVAMEAVEGLSLAAYVASDTLTPHDILVVFRAIASGLAALHDEGLVHCAISSARITVGQDGRPRIGGLSRLTREGQPVAAAKRDNEAWRMAPPEVSKTLSDDPLLAHPSLDIYSFCALLRHSLYGEPLGVSDSSRNAIASEPGAESERRTGGKVSSSVRAMIKKGMASEPSERYDHARAVADILDAATTRARYRWRWVAVAAVLCAAVVFGVAYHRAGSEAASCERGRVIARRSWNDDKATTLAAAFRASGHSAAEAMAGDIAGRLSRYADAWAKTYRDICTRDGDQARPSVERRDRRMYCLERDLGRADAVIELLSDQPDRDLVARSLENVAALQPPRSCLEIDPATLTPRPPPAKREQAKQVLQQVDEIAALVQAGSFRAADGRLAGLTAQVEALALPRVATLAAAVKAKIVAEVSDVELAEPHWRAAIAGLKGPHDAALKVRVWLGLAASLRAQRRWGDWKTALASADSFTSRLSRDAPLHGERALEWARGTIAEAIALDLVAHDRSKTFADYFRTALAECERVGYVRGQIEALTELANRLLRGDPAAALEAIERALKLQRAETYMGHPNEIALLAGKASALWSVSKRVQARKTAKSALALAERSFPPDSPRRLVALNLLAKIEGELGDRKQQVAFYRQALDIARSTYGDDHLKTAAVHSKLSFHLLALDRGEESLTHAQRAVAIRKAQLPADSLLIAAAQGRVSMTKSFLGKWQEAFVIHRQIVELYTRKLGALDPQTLDKRMSLGANLHTAGEYVENDDYVRQAVEVLGPVVAAWEAAAPGVPKPGYTQGICSFAGALTWLKRYDEGAPYAQRCFDLNRKWRANPMAAATWALPLANRLFKSRTHRQQAIQLVVDAVTLLEKSNPKPKSPAAKTTVQFTAWLKQRGVTR